MVKEMEGSWSGAGARGSRMEDGARSKAAEDS